MINLLSSYRSTRVLSKYIEYSIDETPSVPSFIFRSHRLHPYGQMVCFACESSPPMDPDWQLSTMVPIASRGPHTQKNGMQGLWTLKLVFLRTLRWGDIRNNDKSRGGIELRTDGRTRRVGSRFNKAAHPHAQISSDGSSQKAQSRTLMPERHQVLMSPNLANQRNRVIRHVILEWDNGFRSIYHPFAEQRKSYTNICSWIYPDASYSQAS